MKYISDEKIIQQKFTTNTLGVEPCWI